MFYPSEQSKFNFPVTTKKTDKFNKDSDDGWVEYHRDETKVYLKKTIGGTTQYREVRK